jgi:hypothetical protein
MNSTTHTDSWRTLASPRISAYAKVQPAPKRIKATKVRATRIGRDGGGRRRSRTSTPLPPLNGEIYREFFDFRPDWPVQRGPYANDFAAFKRNSLLNGIRISLVRTGNCIQEQETSAAPPQPQHWEPPVDYFLFLRLQLRFVRGNKSANVGRHIQ